MVYRKAVGTVDKNDKKKLNQRKNDMERKLKMKRKIKSKRKREKRKKAMMDRYMKILMHDCIYK